MFIRYFRVLLSSSRAAKEDKDVWRENSQQNFSFQLNDIKYSCLPIKQAGSNKQAGWIISETLTNKQAVINKQGGILVSIQ